MKFKWSKIEQDTFEDIKRIVDHNNLLAYLYFNEEFKVHTDASDLQLGAVIIHKCKHIAFYGRKITDAPKNYTATEKELLIILETLK